MSPSTIDWAAVRQRIRLVGAALELPPIEVEEVVVELARGNEAKLFAFVERYGQSPLWGLGVAGLRDVLDGMTVPEALEARGLDRSGAPPRAHVATSSSRKE